MMIPLNLKVPFSYELTKFLWLTFDVATVVQLQLIVAIPSNCCCHLFASQCSFRSIGEEWWELQLHRVMDISRKYGMAILTFTLWSADESLVYMCSDL